MKEYEHNKTLVTIGQSARHRSIHNGIKHISTSKSMSASHFHFQVLTTKFITYVTFSQNVLRNLPFKVLHTSGGSRISRRGGGVDSRGSYISKILYVKAKESGPLGGGSVRWASVNVDSPLHTYLCCQLSGNKEPEVVIIHDAVRPFVEEQILKDVACAAYEYGVRWVVVQ